MTTTNNAIIASGGFDPANINRKNYTYSLAVEAVRAGLYDEAALERVKADLISALAEVIGYFTMGESSSVKVDTAHKLEESLVYNIDTYLLSLNDDIKAAETLFDRRMSELYGKGYLINKKRLEEARILYGRVRLTRLKKASKAYDSTIDKYFPFYLKTYSPKFTAHSKIYLNLHEYGISGGCHIDEAVEILKKLCDINSGRHADYVISDTPDGENR